MSRRGVVVAVVAVAVVLGAAGGVVLGERKRNDTGGTSTPTSTPSTTGSRTPTSPPSSPSSSSSTGPTQTAGSTPTCATRDLRGSIVGLQAAAGSLHYQIQLRNVGDGPCRLGGYGGLSFVGPAGHRIGAPAERDASQGGPTLLTLAAHASAVAAVTEGDAGNFPAGQCRPRTATALRVYPPNQTASILILHRTQACAGTSEQQLSIQPYRLQH